MNNQETERASSYLFIKTFKVEKSILKHYESVSVKKSGLEVVISNHLLSDSNELFRKLTRGIVLYINKTLSPNSSDRHLAENQSGLPDLLPTQGDNARNL